MANTMEALRIVTNEPRRKVNVDGADYEMLNTRELSLVQKAEALKVSRDLGKFGQDELGPEALAKLHEDLVRVALMVVPGLKDAAAKLADDDLIAILLAFSAAPRKLAPGAEQPSQPDPSQASLPFDASTAVH